MRSVVEMPVVVLLPVLGWLLASRPVRVVFFSAMIVGES